MKYFVYSVNPINDWSMWMGAGQFFEKQLVEGLYPDRIERMVEPIRMIVDQMRRIIQALEVHGLAGVGVLRFSTIPTPPSSETIFAVAQPNEPTYIFSPVPMPWLAPDFVEEPQTVDV